ncbi:MAG: acyl-CoA dehydrogenase, partial [Pseudomonadota bacterium]
MNAETGIAQAAPIDAETLLGLSRDAVGAARAFQATATTDLATRVKSGERVSGALLEAEQYAAHALAWLATYVEALDQMSGWAERLSETGSFGETERLILQIGMGEYLWQLYGGLPASQTEIIRPQDLGLSQDDQRAMMIPAVMTLTQEGNTQ